MTAGRGKYRRRGIDEEEQKNAGGGESRDERCSPFRAAALVRLEMGRDRAVRGFHDVPTGGAARVPPVAELRPAADRGKGRRVHVRQLHLGLRLERDAAALLELGPVRV